MECKIKTFLEDENLFFVETNDAYRQPTLS